MEGGDTGRVDILALGSAAVLALSGFSVLVRVVVSISESGLAECPWRRSILELGTAVPSGCNEGKGARELSAMTGWKS